MAKLYDLVFVGNYTKDTIVSKAGSRNVHGGAVNYGAQVAARLGFTAAVVTRLAKEDSEVVDILEKAGVDVYPEYVPKSTTVILEYPTDNVDHRIIHLKGYAGSITVEQVEDVQGKIFAIGPSIRGEVPLEVIQAIKEKGAKLSLDVQGYIRVVEDGILVNRSWPEMGAYLALVDVLKTDAVEAAGLTGEEDIHKAAAILHEYGPQEVVLTHRDGILVYDGRTYYEQKFYPEELVGRSGRGDTVIATYMAFRETHSPAEALIWAAAATSRKLEVEGPFRGNRADVEQLIAAKYS
jgi:sugar/nucleoside kinase (ribokinase family)